MENITKIQKQMAQICANCVLCRHARKKQKGLVYGMVKPGSRICPFCRAYEKVYGKKSYESYEV